MVIEVALLTWSACRYTLRFTSLWQISWILIIKNTSCKSLTHWDTLRHKHGVNRVTDDDTHTHIHTYLCISRHVFLWDCKTQPCRLTHIIFCMSVCVHHSIRFSLNTAGRVQTSRTQQRKWYDLSSTHTHKKKTDVVNVQVWFHVPEEHSSPLMNRYHGLHWSEDPAELSRGGKNKTKQMLRN